MLIGWSIFKARIIFIRFRVRVRVTVRVIAPASHACKNSLFITKKLCLKDIDSK